MDRQEAYNEIVEAFEKKYSWWGRQWAENFLAAISSWNIQEYSKPEFRIRRHPLLFAKAAWFKSSMLTKSYHILGPDLCMIMSDVTLAALRGTVDNRMFIAPFTLKRPFAIATEFGQVVTGDVEINQKLLNLLEEGIVNVTLAKISSLDPLEREKAQQKYGVHFDDINSFTYTTNWVLMAGTYDQKFLLDDAFKSRFSIVTPEKKFDSELIKFVHKSGPFVVSEACVDFIRSEIVKDEPMDVNINLPDEVYDHGLSPRDISTIVSDLLTKKWWGFKPTKQDAIELAVKCKYVNDSVWKSAEDKVFESLSSDSAKTINVIEKETGLSKKSVYDSIKKLRMVTRFTDQDGKTVYRI